MSITKYKCLKVTNWNFLKETCEVSPQVIEGTIHLAANLPVFLLGNEMKEQFPAEKQSLLLPTAFPLTTSPLSHTSPSNTYGIS